MQPSDRALARRYALAQFQVSLEHKAAEKSQSELAAAFKLIAPRMPTFKHPMESAAQKKDLLKSLLGNAASASTLRFLELLIEKKRFYLLPVIVAEYGRLVDEFKGLVRAQVRSAGDLTKGQADMLLTKLRKFTGKDVTVEVKTDPDLLGGVVVA